MPIASFGWIGQSADSIQTDIAVTPKLLAAIYYDNKSRRYKFKDGNRFVSKTVVLDLIDKKIEEEKQNLKSYAARMQRQEIGVYKDAGKTLKNIHILELAKAKNGFENITNSDLGVLGNTLKNQYYQGVDETTGKPYGLKYLIKDAPTLSTAQLENRLRMYGESGKLTGLKTTQSEEMLKGATMSRRILGITDMHCADCVRYAALGIQPIGVLPLPKTKCRCRNNCVCRIVYF